MAGRTGRGRQTNRRLSLHMTSIFGFLFAAAIFLTAGMLRADDQELLKRTPSEVDGVFYVNILKLVNDPNLKDFMSDEYADEDFLAFKKDLADNGIDVYRDITEGIVCFSAEKIDKPKMAVILRTSNMDEEKFFAIFEKAAQSSGRKIEKTEMHGRKMICLPRGEGKDREMTYMFFADKNILCITSSKGMVATLCATTAENCVLKNERISKAIAELKTGPGTIAWGFFTIRKKQEPGKLPSNLPPPPGGEPKSVGLLECIREGVFLIANNGEGEKADYVSFARILCEDKEKAEFVRNKVNGMILSFASTAFEKKPELANEVAKACAVNLDGETVSIEVKLSQELNDKISAYLADAYITPEMKANEERLKKQLEDKRKEKEAKEKAGK